MSKGGYICKTCGSWIPIEAHGTYCKERNTTPPEPSTTAEADDDTPLNERYFRAGVKEGRRLEREGWLRESAAYPNGLVNNAELRAELTQLRQSLAESERKAAGMRDALKECLDWMQWGTSPKDKTTAWHAMHARGCQALASPAPPTSDAEEKV